MELPVDLVYSLGMTFLHSFWQGGIMYLVVLLLFGIAGRSNVRYSFAVFGLFSFLIISVYTFLYYYYNSCTLFESDMTQISSGTNVLDSGTVFSKITVPITKSSTVYYDYIALFWILGILAMFLRLLWSLAIVNQLRSNVVPFLNEEIQECLILVKGKLNITKDVLLAKANEFITPVTIGWLKPIILLPVAVVNNLTMHEVEIMLAHELAHIKRQDYLVNVLQNIAEALLFFNPFLWMISARIREEREFSCDDMVMKVYGTDRLAVAKVLVKVADISALPHLTLAMAKNNGSLFTLRIKRIIGMEKMRTIHFSQFIILAIFLSVSISGVFFTGNVSARPEGILHDSDSTIAKEKELLYKELRLLYSELDSNSVHLPGIVIKGNRNNQNVVSDLENQVISHLAVNISDEQTQIHRASRIDSLWKLIEKKNARVAEIGRFQRAAFNANFEHFWNDLNNHIELEQVKQISLMNGVLYIDSLAQTNEKYNEVVNVFEKHLGNESFLDLNLHIKRKEIGLSKYSNEWSLALPHIMDNGRKGTSYWLLKSFK